MSYILEFSIGPLVILGSGLEFGSGSRARTTRVERTRVIA